MPSEFFTAVLASVILSIIAGFGFLYFGSFAVLGISLIALLIANRLQLYEKHGLVHDQAVHNTVHLYQLQKRNEEKLSHGEKLVGKISNQRRKLAFRGFYIFSILIVVISFAFEIKVVMNALYPESS
ncbi:MAG: hypothetical protein HON65_16205 [Rhodospirillales bacterium]|jgi:hypothetical protein|nr:hypothetical protein [Rhodospirillales bacterium]